MAESATTGANTENVTWHEAIPFDELWIDDFMGTQIAGHAILLVNVDDEIRAYEDRCPHQASPLSEGDLDGEVLTCARHLWEFNAVTGEGINPDTSRLAEYPVKVESDTIYVGIPVQA